MFLKPPKDDSHIPNLLDYIKKEVKRKLIFLRRRLWRAGVRKETVVNIQHRG